MSLKKYFLIIVAVAALKVTMIAANAVPAFAEDISLLRSFPPVPLLLPIAPVL